MFTLKKVRVQKAEHIITIMLSPARIVLHLIELFHFKVITIFLFNYMYILNYLKVQQTHMPEHNILHF